MKIELHHIKIKELFNGYKNSEEEGVVAYGGKLDIRPPYQREFVYKDKQRNAVIETILQNFPLNVMYWVVKDNGEYEVLDGQQRTISICSYLNGNYSIDNKMFFNLPKDIQEQIENYELMIYFCEGKDSEKQQWFETVNIAGEKLTPQEIRNSIYSGEWLTDAKRHFSKSNGPAYNLAKNYLKGSAIRQDYLETALKWISSISNQKIEDYMAANQHNKHATELWTYFQNVIIWVTTIFPAYRQEMKGIEWGFLYNKFKNNTDLNPNELEEQIKKLMRDEEIQNKSGIYEYLLTGEEKYLNLRAFSDTIKQNLYENQKGICKICEKHFEYKDMEADHIVPWHEGGKTTEDNCQMLCKHCNRTKSGK